MFKRILAGLLALAILSAPALAEVYLGTSVARSTLAVFAQAGGVIEELNIQEGCTVAENEVLARLQTTKVYASQNGTVSRIHAKENIEVRGSVLEISPVSRYTVHCTADEAYDSIRSNLVHGGETLYLYCTNNGTHQGTGRVYSIENETYMVEATGGEFYVGETVYLYRDPDHTYKNLVGVGTVVTSATELYEAEGCIAAIHVQEGEYVERGELLYEVIEGESSDVLSETGGIIVSCDVRRGSKVEKGAAIAQLAPLDEICISIQMDETAASRIASGDDAALLYACDAEEHLVPGEVSEISGLAEDGYYTVYITPETPPTYLGMTVSVQIG